MRDQEHCRTARRAGQDSPASLLQLPFWLEHTIDPCSPAYHVPSIFLIEGDLDSRSLERALSSLLHRHAVFQSTFALDGSGRLVQRTNDCSGFTLPVEDPGTPATRESAEQAAREEIRHPFDLAAGPLVRCRLFRIAGRSHMLVITAHHIIFDLATKDLFAEELAAGYEAEISGRPAVVAPEEANYARFVEWQEQWLATDECRSMERAWLAHMEHAETELHLPGTQLSSGLSRSGAVIPIGFSRQERDRIAVFCRQEGKLTPFLVLLLAWAQALCRVSGQNKLCVGVPFTNRRRPEFKTTRGCFVNILPLPIDMTDGPSVAEALGRIRLSLLQMHRMQEVPYYRLVQLMRRSGAASGTPLFQVGFTFEHPMRLQLPGLAVTPIGMHPGGAQLDAFATFWEEEGELAGRIEYDRNRLDEGTAQSLRDGLRTHALELCTRPAFCGIGTHPGPALQNINCPSPLLLSLEGRGRQERVNLHDGEGVKDKDASLEEGQVTSLFWKKQLGGELPRLDLPSIRKRRSGQPRSRRFRSFTLDRGTCRCMAALAREAGTSPDRILLAAFQALLMRYSGQEDILVLVTMVPGSGQGEPCPDERLDPVPIRCTVARDLTFRELVNRTAKTMQEAAAHRNVSFPLLAKQYGKPLDPDDCPLSPVAFGVADPDAAAPCSNPAAGVGDLCLTMISRGELITGLLAYTDDVFEDAVVERMAGHVQVLASAGASAPDLRLHELPLLTASEKEQLLVHWNATEAPYPADACIHELVEAQAARTPDAVAVQFGDRRMTYHELDRESEALAGRLREKGVAPGAIVAVYVERGLEMAISLLGILKAGAAYLPLDRMFPRDRLAFMLSDAAPLVMVTTPVLERELPQYAGTVVVVKAGQASETARNAGARPSSGDLAYVLYTSGSTGRPKGVQIPHRAVVNFLFSMARQPGIGPDDRLLSVTTISFDILGLELWLPLSTGARVIIAPEHLSLDGKALARALDEGHVTIMQATPATWRLLLDAGWKGTRGLKALCGGEAWPQDLAAQLRDACGSVWNMYGPTETTIWSAVQEVQKGDRVTLGRPIANTTFYVVDDRLQPVPVGIPGELLIGGDGLARGYLNRPELNAEKFIPDPFSAAAGARVYRTGDLVRYLPDGNLEYLARLDQQVKIRGYRVELGEVENALHELPGVRQAAAAAHESGGTNRLTAYLVCEGDGGVTVNEARRLLKERLPEYMVPASFIVLDKFPLTPNGKIDRKNLPRPTGLRPDMDTAYAAPRSEIERTIAGVWRDVLGVGRIGVHDGFFDLGGNSLSMARVRTTLCRLLLRELTMVELFTYPTIASLAQYLGSVDDAGSRGQDMRVDRIREGKARTGRRLHLYDESAARAKSRREDPRSAAGQIGCSVRQERSV